jgi:hypothetical protein
MFLKDRIKKYIYFFFFVVVFFIVMFVVSLCNVYAQNPNEVKLIPMPTMTPAEESFYILDFKHDLCFYVFVSYSGHNTVIEVDCKNFK